MAALLIGFCLIQDLGTFGATFPIEEADLLVVLHERLTQVQQNEQSKLALQSPKGRKLPKAKHLRIHYFDPSLVLKEDIKDADGKLLFKKGQQINPLETLKLSKELLFFNGNDPLQLAWAKMSPGTWILTEGNPIELEESENRPIYFDQGGALSQKLGIESLPARVSQHAVKLQIQEIPCF
jgi:conjugal transfer pilus assembly protein TraW